MKKLILLLLLTSLCLGKSQAQETAVVPGEIIVMLDAETHISDWMRTTSAHKSRPGFRLLKTISPQLNIYLIHFDPQNISPEQALLEAKYQQGTKIAQFNHLTELRRTSAFTPNDTRFPSQWHLNNTGQAGGQFDADIDAPEAWDLNRGGLTVFGDSIVTAVVDEGFDIGHADLKIWTNRAEIPGNGFDDDHNGYVDDERGWDFLSSSSTHPISRHGTIISGIIGAKSNNNLGVTGIDHGAKVLTLTGATATEATVVEAYSYLHFLRRKYNRTQGQEGAFIVSANSSFGINNGDPANFPLWCAMYDSLGAEGILSVVAVANRNINTNTTHDMPTNCRSPYMIAVTATDRWDQRLSNAAFGAVHVDLGAPGQDIFSTSVNGYGSSSGTSMAAPMVTGALSLMMAEAGDKFMAYYDNFPDSMSLILKARLMASTDQIPSMMNGVTQSGGRLNLHAALLEIANYSQNLPACTPPYHLFAQALSDSSVRLSWESISGNDFILKYRQAGGQWIRSRVQGHSLLLKTLTSCQKYDFKIAASCGADSSIFSKKMPFETLGCCRAPLLKNWIAGNSDLEFHWNPVYGAQAYRLQYREKGNSIWTDANSSDTTYLLAGLATCRAYEYRLGVQCGAAFSYNNIQTANTSGCEACTDILYCESISADASDDWIDSVKIGPIQNKSGSNGGYLNQANESAQFKRGKKYAFTLAPGFSGTTYDEYWRIWIDFNQDGDFDDAGEKVYELSASSALPISDSIAIPDTAKVGFTRMRVSMRFVSLPAACQSFSFGEVEDYCVELVDFGTGVAEKMPDAFQVQIQRNASSLRLVSDVLLESVEVFDLNGKNVLSKKIMSKRNDILLSKLFSGIYILKIKSIDGRMWNGLFVVK